MINKRNIVLLCILVSLLLAQMVNGQVDVKKTGQSTMKFLNVSVSPRSAAMGDAYLNVGTGAVSMFYNPAALTEMKTKFDMFLSSTRWIADINYYSGSLAWNAGNIGTFGASFLFVDYGVIHGTQLDAFSNVVGVNYVETGELSNVGAYSAGIGYAKKITDQFSMGGNVMLAGQQLGTHPNAAVGDQGSSKLIFNLGVKYFPGFMKSFRFGMNIRNFGTNVKYEYISAQMPTYFAMGLALNVFEVLYPELDQDDTALTLSAQFEHPNDYTERMLVGAEYMFGGMLFLRAGYKFNYDLEGFSGGFGLTKAIGGSKVNIDYSYSIIEMLSNVQRISCNYSF